MKRMTGGLLVVLVIAGQSVAQEPFVFEDYLAHNKSLFAIPIQDPNLLSPVDFHFEFEWPDTPNPLFTYDFLDVTPADLDLVWTFTAENAHEIGIDWDQLVENSLHHWPGPTPVDPVTGQFQYLEPTSTIDTPLGTFEKGACCNFTFKRMDHWSGLGPTIEKVRVHVSEFFYYPNDHVVYFGIGTTLHGRRPSGVIPEPTSLVLLLGLTGGGACAFGRGRPGAN